VKGAGLSLEAVGKAYGGITAVDEVSFVIPPGELLTLLGPSGCGKSTILRMIAGFVPPDSGRVELGGINIASLPPERRETAMVFQTYALFPHLRLRDNIAFGLRVRRLDRKTIERKVAEALELVRLETLPDLYPHQLSGGQQQRAALARALVIEPKLLLLDEPFGALDRALREQMQVELRKIQQALHITTLFVTHDQQEAFILSDQIAVMNGGHIEQIGPPNEIYDQPRTRFVAEFIGASNILEGRIERVNGCQIDILLEPGIHLQMPTTRASQPGKAIQIAVRPSAMRIASQQSETRPSLPGTIGFLSNQGARLGIEVVLMDGRVVTVDEARDPHAIREAGAKVFVEFQEQDCIVLSSP
jgi:putative spermidine/putrescine transport system ATP-binding protein